MKQGLAILLRPKKMGDVIGQKHLVDKKTGLLTKMVKHKYLPNLILSGAPGVGKSTLARILVQELQRPYGIFNAATDKKDYLEALIKEAKKQSGYVLIIEEIHRMNCDRQDVLLNDLEQGFFTIIAITSENPYFVVNQSLRSRSLVLKLKPIEDNEMLSALEKVIKDTNLPFKITTEALQMLVYQSAGDFRVAINKLEIFSELFVNEEITSETIKQVIPETQYWNFKSGDEHNNLKSALQKSIRGSDVDASLHYLSRLLTTGDYEALLRRLLIIAYEDIGLANPAIPLRVQGAITAFRQIGMPEGIIPLGLAVVEMALSEKSNSTYLAINKAYQDVMLGKVFTMPDYLTKNYFGKKYKYPHDFPNSFIKQKYLPKELNSKYYQPKKHSIYEKKVNELYERFTK